MKYLLLVLFSVFSFQLAYAQDAGIDSIGVTGDFCTDDTVTLCYTLTNFSTGTLDSVQVVIELGNAVYEVLNFNTDTLAGGADTTLCTLLTGFSDTDQVVIYTTLPNGTTDTVQSNDTLLYSIQISFVTASAGMDTTVCAFVPVVIGGAPTATGDTAIAWSNSSLLNDSSLANPTATFTTAGSFTFFVEAFSATGCVASDTVSVTVFPIPVIDAGPDTFVCTGISAQIGGSPTAPALVSLLWSNETFLDDSTAQNPVATVNISTDFVVTGTDTSGCQYTDTVFVFVYAPAFVDAGADTSICSGDSASLGGSPVATNFDTITWSSAALLNNAHLAHPMAGPTDTTTFIITLTDTFGCVWVDSVNVFVMPVPQVDAGPDTVVCNGVAFTGGGNPTGAATSFFNWSPGALCDDSTVANPQITITQDTQMVVSITDFITGCSASDTVQYTVATPPVINISVDTLYNCQGDTVALGDNPLSAAGNTAIWTPTQDIDDSTALNPLLVVDQTYHIKVTVTDAITGCTNIDSILIAAQITPVVNAGNDTVVCTNDTVFLGGSPTSSFPGTYQWFPASLVNDDTLSNPWSVPLQDTFFIVEVNTQAGCHNTDTMYVTVNPLPVPVVTPVPQVCAGLTSQLQVTGAPQFTWSNASLLSDSTIGNPTTNVTSTTIFHVTLTDNNGCQDSTQVLVNPYPLPNVQADDDTICNGQATLLMATGASVYQWSPATGLDNPNIANPTATPSSTTVYYLQGTDGNNCVAFDTVTVSVNLLPPANAGPDVTVCSNASVQLGGSPTGPSGSTYSWPPQYITNNTAANPTYTASGLAAGNYPVVVTVTDANQCSSTDQVIVTVFPLPTAAIAPFSAPICVGETLGLTASGSITYQWGPAINIGATNGPSTSVWPTSTTNYIVTVTDANGCTDTETAAVTVHPPVLADAGADETICFGQTVALSATGGTNYQWSPNLFLSNNTVANPTCSTPVTRTYTVVVTDGNGCTESDDVVVTVNPLPTSNAGPDKEICVGESVVLGGTPTGPSGSTFVWSPAASLQGANTASPVATPLVTTDYTVEVTSTLGCTSSNSVTVVVHALPVVSLVNAPEPACAGTFVEIGVTEGFASYQWSPNTKITVLNAANTSVNPDTSAVYAVLVTDENGCRNSLNVPVTILPLPTPDAGDDRRICKGDSAFVQVTGGASYQWAAKSGLDNLEASSNWLSPGKTTTYTISATDLNGCVGKTEVTVNVYELPFADAGDDLENCDMTSVMLGGNPTGPEDAVYVWTPAEGLSDPFSPNPFLVSIDRATYTVEVQNENGCRSTDTVRINSDCFSMVFAPTAFTPGTNGINDEFRVTHYRVHEPLLVIYDRFGQLVFETRDLDIGWDGSTPEGNNAALNSVFYWRLTYMSETNEQVIREGTVAVIR